MLSAATTIGMMSCFLDMISIWNSDEQNEQYLHAIMFLRDEQMFFSTHLNWDKHMYLTEPALIFKL